MAEAMNVYVFLMLQNIYVASALKTSDNNLRTIPNRWLSLETSFVVLLVDTVFLQVSRVVFCALHKQVSVYVIPNLKTDGLL